MASSTPGSSILEVSLEGIGGIFELDFRLNSSSSLLLISDTLDTEVSLTGLICTFCETGDFYL